MKVTHKRLIVLTHGDGSTTYKASCRVGDNTILPNWKVWAREDGLGWFEEHADEFQSSKEATDALNKGVEEYMNKQVVKRRVIKLY